MSFCDFSNYISDLFFISCDLLTFDCVLHYVGSNKTRFHMVGCFKIDSLIFERLKSL